MSSREVDSTGVKEHERAAMVRTVALASVVVVTSFQAVVMLLLPDYRGRALVVIASVAAISMAALEMNRRGRVRGAALAVVVGLISLVTLLAATGGGIRAPATGVYVVTVLVAGLVLGQRAGIVTGIVCIAAGLGLVVAEQRGVLLGAAVVHTPVTLWLIQGLTIGLAISVLGMATSVVGRALHRVERELRDRQRAEERLEQALDAAGIGVWEHDLAANRTHADDRLFAMFGRTRRAEGVPEEEWLDWVHSEDVATMHAAVQALAHTPGRTRHEFRVVQPDGSVRYVEAAAATVVDAEGRPEAIVGMNVDVTEKTLAGREMRRALRALSERVKELTLLHRTARLLTSDRPFDGQLIRELVAAIPEAWQHPDVCVARIAFGDVEAASPGWRDSPWKQTAAFGTEKRPGVIEVAYLEERPDEDEGPFMLEERTLLESLTELLDAHLEHAQAEDARRRLEAQLRQRQKMDALGTLAGGIAHDFNNILAAISINVQLALLDTAPEHPLRQSLEEIGEAGARAKELVKQILTFSRQTEVSLRSTDLRPVVEEALRLLRVSLSKRIRVDTAWHAELPSVRADTTQIHQVVMNLGTNAGHAMAETGGVLRFALEPMMIDASMAALSPDLTPGPYVRLTVDDTGPGCPKRCSSASSSRSSAPREIGARGSGSRWCMASFGRTAARSWCGVGWGRGRRSRSTSRPTRGTHPGPGRPSPREPARADTRRALADHPFEYDCPAR